MTFDSETSGFGIIAQNRIKNFKRDLLTSSNESTCNMLDALEQHRIVQEVLAPTGCTLPLTTRFFSLLSPYKRCARRRHQRGRVGRESLPGTHRGTTARG